MPSTPLQCKMRERERSWLWGWGAERVKLLEDSNDHPVLCVLRVLLQVWTRPKIPHAFSDLFIYFCPLFWVNISHGLVRLSLRFMTLVNWIVPKTHPITLIVSLGIWGIFLRFPKFSCDSTIIELFIIVKDRVWWFNLISSLYNLKFHVILFCAI